MDNFLSKMERKFGKYAIRNLPLYLLICYAFGYLMNLFKPEWIYIVNLNPYAILHGQVWRLFTWILVPEETQIFFIIIVQAAAKYFGFDTLAYLTDNIVNWGFLALIIIFQPEIRSILEKVGKSNVFNRMNTLSGSEKEDLVQALMDAASNLAESKTGALITIEQTTSLSEYAKTGVHMNSEVSAELLCSIFQTTTPLHDGAVIIQGDRISSASVYFPPTQLDLPSRYGARHRAAIGISEISDAITIVVSEETGRVAIAEQGKLIKMNEKKLRAYLYRVILNRDTVADEMVSSVGSESVSIDSLFKKEMNAAEEELKMQKTQELSKTELAKSNAAPGHTSVVIVDETEDDPDDTAPVVHVAEMKTFGKADFHSDLSVPAVWMVMTLMGQTLAQMPQPMQASGFVSSATVRISP